MYISAKKLAGLVAFNALGLTLTLVLANQIL